MSEARGRGQKEQPHTRGQDSNREEQPHSGGRGGDQEEQILAQGVVGLWAQEGLEEPSHIEAQKGRW